MKSKKKHSNRRYRNVAIITILLTPSLVFILMVLHAGHSLFETKYYNIEARMDELYSNGWPIEYQRAKFKEDIPAPSIAEYLYSPFSYPDLDYYESEINYATDVEFEEAMLRLKDFRADSTDFYVEEIQQPTENLELLYELADEGLDTENYDLLSFALYEVSGEIDTLREQQQDDILARIEHNMQAMEGIVFMAQFYGLDLSSQYQQVLGISSETSALLDVFNATKEVKDSLASQLNDAIIQRGGWSTDGKRILISIGRQRLYMIEDYEITYEMPASTGIRGHGTAAGEFQVYEKVPMAWGYYRIWMPHWLTIYYSGGLENGIHGIPISPSGGRWSHWDSVVGVSPITYGCVMPHDWDAQIVYEWADVGTPVSIVY